MSILVFACVGCGSSSGPSAADMQRSVKEFELAASLHQEGDMAGAFARLERSVALDPDNAEAFVLMGVIRYQRGELEQAEEALEKSVSLFVAQERLGATLAEARNMLGVIYVEQRKFPEAIDVLTKSAQDATNRAPHLALGNLGLAYKESGDAPKALDALSRAVSMQPRFCVGHHRIGQIHFEQEKFEEAEAALAEAVSADESCASSPLLQNAWRLRGEASARLGRADEAVEFFERCAALNQKSEDGQACARLLAGGAS